MLLHWGQKCERRVSQVWDRRIAETLARNKRIERTKEISREDLRVENKDYVRERYEHLNP